jgi:hypothetical protein
VTGNTPASSHSETVSQSLGLHEADHSVESRERESIH